MSHVGGKCVGMCVGCVCVYVEGVCGVLCALLGCDGRCVISRITMVCGYSVV